MGALSNLIVGLGDIVAKDLRVVLRDDRPGSLAALVQALGDSGINIDGVAEIDGVVHLLVEDAEAARVAVEASNNQVTEERDVLVISLPDRPGELARVVRRIADAGVNVSFVYLATSTRVVIGVEDIAAAHRAAGG
jgi:hypothetical protein